MMQIKNNISLLEYNTFGIDVTAETMVIYDFVDELKTLITTSLHTLPTPLLHIGEGSNLLFLRDFCGTILLSNIRDVEIVSEHQGQVIVRVGAGWKMDDFIDYAISHGWYGLENLSLIPGQVGASAVQNIGAYGVEVGDHIHAVNCISLQDGETRRFTHDECTFSYRHSIFKTPELRGKYAVTSVEYALSTTFQPNLEYKGILQCLAGDGIAPSDVDATTLRQTIIKIREDKLPDPRKQGNAGSFFMNPVVDKATFLGLRQQYPDIPHYTVDDDHIKIPAAWLIDQCGWKGQTLGRAGVHDRQPLVLVNMGGAQGADIAKLSARIQADVLAKFNISISPEVNFI